MTLVTARDRVLMLSAHGAAKLLGESFEIDGWQPTQERTLRAIQSRLIDHERRQPTPTAFDRTMRVVHGFSNYHQDRLRALLTLLEASTLLTYRKRFTALLNPDQDGVLHGWSQSRIPTRRAAFHGLKSVCMLGYYSDDASWPSIGYSLADNPGFLKKIEQ